MSWMAAVHKVLTALRDPGEEHGRRLEVPVAIPHVAMPEVGGEGDHVTRDAGVVGGAIHLVRRNEKGRSSARWVSAEDVLGRHVMACVLGLEVPSEVDDGP